MHVGPEEGDPAHAARFSVWRIPGRKVLIGDGRRLLLLSIVGRRMLRLAIGAGLREGAPYAYTIRAGPRAKAHWRAVENFIDHMERRHAPRELAIERPSRLAIVHMRTLQALDGVLAGASQREIAAAIFGADRVARDWAPDSELRAQVRHLIRRGRAFMNGEYRSLLGTASEMPKGERRTGTESP